MLSSRSGSGRRLYRVLLVAAPVLALAIAQACAAPTQARVRLRSTLTCDQLNGVNIVVGPSSEVAEARVGERAVNTSARDCVPDPAGSFVDLGTVVLAPGEDRGAIVVVAGTKNLPGVSPRAADLCGVRTASGLGDYKDCIVARRRFSYVSNRSLEFTITLDNACINQPCDAATETCSAGKCVTAELSCQNDACIVPNEAEDAATPRDAAATDDATPPPVRDATPPEPPVVDAMAVDAPIVEPPPAALCAAECPGATANTSTICAGNQECCATSFSGATMGMCIAQGGQCSGPTMLSSFARLCCTQPCGKGHVCVASPLSTPGGTPAVQTQCLKDTDPRPAGGRVVCSTISDCLGTQKCLPVSYLPEFALRLCQ